MLEARGESSGSFIFTPLVWLTQDSGHTLSSTEKMPKLNQIERASLLRVSPGGLRQWWSLWRCFQRPVSPSRAALAGPWAVDTDGLLSVFIKQFCLANPENMHITFTDNSKPRGKTDTWGNWVGVFLKLQEGTRSSNKTKRSPTPQWQQTSSSHYYRIGKGRPRRPALPPWLPRKPVNMRVSASLQIHLRILLNSAFFTCIIKFAGM